MAEGRYAVAGSPCFSLAPGCVPFSARAHFISKPKPTAMKFCGHRCT